MAQRQRSHEQQSKRSRRQSAAEAVERPIEERAGPVGAGRGGDPDVDAQPIAPHVAARSRSRQVAGGPREPLVMPWPTRDVRCRAPSPAIHGVRQSTCVRPSNRPSPPRLAPQPVRHRPRSQAGRQACARTPARRRSHTTAQPHTCARTQAPGCGAWEPARVGAGGCRYRRARVFPRSRSRRRSPCGSRRPAIGRSQRRATLWAHRSAGAVSRSGRQRRRERGRWRRRGRGCGEGGRCGRAGGEGGGGRGL